MKVTSDVRALPDITINNRIVFLERYLHSLDDLVRDCQIKIPDLHLGVTEQAVLALLNTNALLDGYSDEFMEYVASQTAEGTILQTDYSSCEELQNISDRITFAGENYGGYASSSRIGGYGSVLRFTSSFLENPFCITHHFNRGCLKYPEYDWTTEEEHDCRKYVTTALARCFGIGTEKQIVPNQGANDSCDDCSYVMIEQH